MFRETLGGNIKTEKLFDRLDFIKNKLIKKEHQRGFEQEPRLTRRIPIHSYMTPFQYPNP
jgi:hypothetical protein